MPLTGHCNCTAITVTIADPKEGKHSTMYCHCTTCKRQSGAFGTCVLIADDDQVKIEDPKGYQKTWNDDLTDSGTPLKRQFCGNCGCPITSLTSRAPGKTIVKMGLFDDIPAPVAEMYCKNRESWQPAFGEALGIATMQAGS